MNEIEVDLINIGSGEEISIKNLANTIKEIVEFKGDLVFNTDKPDGNPRKLLDSSLINELGWRSATSLNKGLKSTYDWYKENQAKVRRS